MSRTRTNIEIEDSYVRAIMDRFGVHTKTEAVDLALRHLAGQPMTRQEALAIRGAGAIDDVPVDLGPDDFVILVDTSAWVEYDRATGSATDRRLAELIGTTDEVAVTEPVVMEVVAGARNADRELELRRLLQRFDLMRFDAAIDFDGAARIYRSCRQVGITPRGMVDCMIAAVAHRHRAVLLACDADLTRVANVVGVDLDLRVELVTHPLLPVGWSDRVAAWFAPLLDEGLVPARVVGVERGFCRVATPSGERMIPVPDMAVGDWVALDGDAIRDALPRWSELARLGPEGQRQVLAANVDLVLIAAPADRLSSARVEREVVMAWESGARPVVVLTKLDLAAPGAVDDLASRLVTVDVIPTSAVTGDGMDAIRALLVHPVTAAFLGPSGAGKSTLINALLGEDRLAVGEVRDGDQRGRHTTSSRRLVPLPSGGSLIDMPGLRSLGTDAGDDAVAATFADIDALADTCRFADCSHEMEPGCAVAAALERGDLDPARLESYRKLVRETAFEQRRADPVAQAEQTKVWKARTKEQRRLYRDREQ